MSGDGYCPECGYFSQCHDARAVCCCCTSRFDQHPNDNRGPTLGVMVIFTPLCSYSRMFRSGFVDKEKIGCSIDPISSFGIASVTSQIKKSWIGWRSGRRGDRFEALLSDIRESCVHTGGRHYRAFTQGSQASCFHPWTRGFRAFTRASPGTDLIVYLHMRIRAFTRSSSCFHTKRKRNH